MKICKTIDEIKEYAEVNISFDPDNLLPAEKKVVRFVKNILSDAEYDSLQANYTASSLTADQEALLPYVQDAMVSLAMIKWVGGCGQTEITNAGVHLNLSKDRKTAFQWQIIDLQRHFKNEGYRALENLLQYLWKSGSLQYLLWRASSNRTEYLQYLINDSVDFSKGYQIHENFAFFLYLRETMDFVEEQYIVPVIGQDLFDEIKDEILAGTISPENAKILKWLRKAVAHKTIYHAIPKLVTFVDEFGIRENFLSQIMTTQAEQPARNEFVSLQLNQADTDGEKYLLKVRKYLIENIDDYPLYTLPSNNDLKINDSTSAIFMV